ncbi:LysR family transcriptional regulator [Rarobacter faecitabidus]|uniref:DNA-binding transcriptional LysR family regulator n=1 Tax=Rarobacter faecitabidus TaxID=13243 RepID=A0A542ZA96_RARFA|nr:LysR family transcriptional regulator [Rarobacter faecitabidus]TQL57160.1 DNA-binding transcriptional LysR family regulator [Rarobacter faecitabidus]
MLSVPRMRILLELRRHGTLAEVAYILNYTPSAISQQLSALEAETHVALTERVGRGLRLTRQGEILANHAEIVIAQLEQAEAELAASLGEVGGRMRIACFQSVLLTLVPETLTLLAQRFPELQIEVTQYDEPDAVGGLLSHEYDLILGEEYPGQPIRGSAGIEWDLLTLDPLRAALPMSGPWSDPRAVLAGLASAPWVLENESSAFGRWAIALMQEQGFTPHVPFVSTDILLHLHLVETGHAVALVPDLLWLSQTPRVRLVPLPGNPQRRLLTGVRDGSGGHPAIVALRQALRDVTDELHHRANSPAAPPV